MQSSLLLSQQEARAPAAPGNASADALIESALLASTLACWRELDGHHRMLVDRDCRLVEFAPSFFYRENCGRDFVCSDGKIAPRDSRFFVNFRSLVGTYEAGTLLIPRRESSGHWICRASPLAGQYARRIVGLSFHPAGVDVRSEWSDFSDAFGMTHAENQVLRHTMCGSSPREVAATLGLSINTVRTHLQHVHDKIDVRDQHQLWRCLGSYRIR